MLKRRDLLRLGLSAGAAQLLASGARAQDPYRDLTRYLCPPDDVPRDLDNLPPSPIPMPPGLSKTKQKDWIRKKSWAFMSPLFVPPIMNPVPAPLNPPPDPRAHQRYDEFIPQKIYEIREREFRWRYHTLPPYTQKVGGRPVGSWSWGFEDAHGKGGPSTPGPTYHARYGEPVLVRLYNDLPTVGHARVPWALPSTTIHLHNGHTASESDGNPQDWVQPGEFWDHHYPNFPSGFDPREKLTTLWYHDHRMDFTAANVYAGLAGFYLLFDEEDTGDETTGWRLPSGEFDIPLIIQDARLAVDRGIDPTGIPAVVFEQWNTDGMIGDLMTVNRVVSPVHRVQRRKYRLRLLNGGPSRFYLLKMFAALNGRKWPDAELDEQIFTIITGDGNLLPEPVEAWGLYLSVAQRVDVIVDFSKFEPGQMVYILNVLEQNNGAGPSGRTYEPDGALPIVAFEVGPETPADPSRIPDQLRPLPTIDLSDVKRTRTWDFDYDGGLWTINGRVFDPNRIDAGIDQSSAEIWVLRNGGNDWSHPIHSHFTEFMLLEINGQPYRPGFIQTGDDEGLSLIEYLGRKQRQPARLYMGGPRRDVATLLPGDEVKVIMKWNDFLGKHVMHCHNVVHEDHAMMIRWDIMEPGRGFDEPRDTAEVYGVEGYDPPFPDDRPPARPHLENRPAATEVIDG